MNQTASVQEIAGPGAAAVSSYARETARIVLGSLAPSTRAAYQSALRAVQAGISRRLTAHSGRVGLASELTA